MRSLTWLGLVLGLFLSLPSPPARAQGRGGVEVTASLSEAVVKLGAPLRISVRVDGPVRSARVVELPTVEGLRFGPVGSASQFQGVQMINGRRNVTRSLTWQIPVQPDAIGDYTIPPIALEVDGRRYETAEQRLRVVTDMQGEDLGYFRFEHPERVYEGAPFTLTMTFGWDAALDQINYANLSLPWLGQLPGTLELGTQATGLGRTIEISLNSRERIEVESLGIAEIGDRTLRLFRLRKRYTAARSGRLDLPTSHLEFGRVRERGGFFREREVSKSYYKRSDGFTIEVRELPEEGRPFDFTGAVGQIDVQADVDRREVDAGESIKLTVEWTGDANLEFFDPPDPSRVDGFEDFRVYGRTDRKSFDRRIVIYDLAPISDRVTEIPPLPLTVFDTEAERYTTVTTRSIPIRVRALAGASGLASAGEGEHAELDLRGLHTAPHEGRELPRPGSTTTLVALFGLPLGWLGLRTLVRRRGDPASAEARRRRSARRRLARELSRATRASDESAALLRFLAARTGEAELAWLGRDVTTWLAGSPDAYGDEADVPLVPSEDAHALANLLAELDEHTWAGDDSPLGTARVLTVADQLLEGGL